MKDGSTCRVFPQYKKYPDGRVEKEILMPANPTVYHKSRMPRVMFLAVTARPRAEYAFDGKICIWPFTLKRKTKRSDKRTSTVAGVTTILESVSVTAEEYRRVMLMKGGVFEMIRKCGGSKRVHGNQRQAK